MTDTAQSTIALSRRAFLSALTMAGAHALVRPSGLVWAQGKAPALVTSDTMRPGVPYGVASGDVGPHSAIIWSRADRPSQMVVEYASTESMRHARRVMGPNALESSDFTAKLNLVGLPDGQRIFYRVYFQDLADPKRLSEPVQGSFMTAPKQRHDIRFAWSGDTAGQGFGINPEWGGMKLYEVMRQQEPDFFIHSGDYIYADGSIPEEVSLDDGSVWKNVTTPEKSKVAETLAEFPDFLPLWEFVAGPLNAGTYGPNKLDNTFGPQVMFQSIPDGLEPKRPPSEGYQFFGAVRIDGKSDVMTVSLHNLEGTQIYNVDLEPKLKTS